MTEGESDRRADRADDPAFLRDEIARLRAILVERDQELGDARGRLAEMEANPLYLPNAVGAIRARILRPVKGAVGRLRRPRG